MNKRREKKEAPFLNIGASSLLVIFLVLCLATFAILSLTSAQSDYTFSQKLAHRKLEYFEANAAAEYVLDDIDAILSQAYHAVNTANDSTAAFSSYLFYAEEALKEINSKYALSLTLDFSKENPTIDYYVMVNDKQNLYVTLTLSPFPSEGDVYYQISQWRLLPSKEWQGDQTLDLLK